MPFRITVFLGAVLVSCLIWVGTPSAQRAGMFHGSAADPAIDYAGGPLDNVIDVLNKKIDAGTIRLTFDGRSGYLESALEAIGLPIDSQIMVFSRASLQGKRVSE